VRWDPVPGDRFVVERAGAAGAVLFVGEPNDPTLAPDHRSKLLWLPREEQLRGLLAGTFRRLERAPTGAWTVRIEVNGLTFSATHDDAEEAYALALVRLVDAGE